MMLLRIDRTTKNPAIPSVNWNSVFSNPRRVRWIVSDPPPPNAPLNDDFFFFMWMTEIYTMDMMMVTRLSAISTSGLFLLQRER